MMLNPLGPILEGLRLCVAYDHNLIEPLSTIARKGEILVWSPWYLVYSGAWATALFLASLVVFHRAEAKFAEYV
jgi:ABC-type polysaccharide/polyol phosphate export permease